MAESVDFEDLKNAGVLMFVVIFFITSYRCFARYTKKLWWHDDSVALFSALAFIFFLIGSTYLTLGSSNRKLGVVGSYILMVGYYTPVWGARISIVLTVVRITPWQPQKKLLLCVALFFLLQFVMLTVQTYWVCEITYPEWKQIPGSLCILPKVVPISQIITMVISDTILIATPLLIVRGVHVPALRFRLFFIFSMSIGTMLASLVHVILMVVKPGVWEAIFGVEATVSVIVCSMSVIIPAVLRSLGVGDPFMQQDTVDPGLSTGVEIAHTSSTRIELGLPTTVSTAVWASDDSEVDIGRTAPRWRRDSVDFGAKEDKDHRLTMQTSEASLGNLKAKQVVREPADERDITDSIVQVRSLPATNQDRDIEERGTGRNST